MNGKTVKMPRSESSLRIGRAVKRFLNLPIEQRLQVMVKANLATQEAVDKAIKRLGSPKVKSRKKLKSAIGD